MGQSLSPEVHVTREADGTMEENVVSEPECVGSKPGLAEYLLCCFGPITFLTVPLFPRLKTWGQKKYSPMGLLGARIK